MTLHNDLHMISGLLCAYLGGQAMTDAEFDDCVSGFYQAASGTLDWGAALRPMHERFHNWVTHVLALDLASGSIAFSFEVGDSSPEAFVDFAREWHRRDPRTQLALSMDEGEWLNCSRHFDENFVAHDPFFQEFMIPYGGRWVSGMKLIHEGDFVAMLALMRGVSQLPYTAAEDELAQRLARHLAQALRLYRSNAMLAGQASSGLALLANLRTPVALVDEQRQIHYANPAASALLKQGNVIGDHGGRLVCRRHHDDAELLIALRSLRLSPGAYLGEGRLPVDRACVRCALPDSHLHLNVFLQAVRPESSLGAFGRIPLAMALLHDPRQRLELDPFMVAAAFQLTPAEAQLAVRLARGETVADVAAGRRVSQETVRSQLKSVFSKTGAVQQSDLVSLLATLPAAGRTALS